MYSSIHPQPTQSQNYTQSSFVHEDISINTQGYSVLPNNSVILKSPPDEIPKKSQISPQQNESNPNKDIKRRKCYRCLPLYAVVLIVIIGLTNLTMYWWNQLPSDVIIYFKAYVIVKSIIYGVALINVPLRFLFFQRIYRWVLFVMCLILAILSASIVSVSVLSLEFLHNLCTAAEASANYNNEATSTCENQVKQIENDLYAIAGIFAINDYVLPILAYCLAAGFKEHLVNMKRLKQIFSQF